MSFVSTPGARDAAIWAHRCAIRVGRVTCTAETVRFRRIGCRAVINKNPAGGMAGRVHLGVMSATPRADGLWGRGAAFGP